MGIFGTIGASLENVTVTGSALLAKVSKFVGGEEGLRLEAYPDPLSKNGLPVTIGYGTTRIDGKPVKLGTKITQAQALSYKLADLRQAIAAVKKAITISLNDNQITALASLVYNCGAGVLNDKLIRLINSGASDRDIFTQWEVTRATSGGRKSQALRKRRQREARLFTGLTAIASGGANAIKKFDIKKILPFLLIGSIAIFLLLKKK